MPWTRSWTPSWRALLSAALLVSALTASPRTTTPFPRRLSLCPVHACTARAGMADHLPLPPGQPNAERKLCPLGCGWYVDIPHPYRVWSMPGGWVQMSPNLPFYDAVVADHLWTHAGVPTSWPDGIDKPPVYGRD